MKNTTPKSNGRRREPSILLHADNRDPDMWYFSRFNAFDPYLAFSVDGRRVAVIHSAEYGRMVKESVFDEILLLDEVRQGAAKRFKLPGGMGPDLHQMVLHLAELHDIPNFRHPDPVGK